MSEDRFQNQKDAELARQERVKAANQGLLNKPVDQLTAYDIDRMPSEIYKQRMVGDPKFVTRVNEIYTVK